MVKTGIVDAAAGNSGVSGNNDEEQPSKLVVAAKDRMIRAEPAIYPVGNAMISLPFMPFNQWHDANAQEIGRDKVAKLDTLNLVSSMSVIDVQQKLNALGYDAGPVDGLMGGRTMRAIKSFQRENSLTVNGTIDATTTLTLINK
jgi:hypothetical protein